jgi:addiction module RelE/StbE family toxin
MKVRWLREALRNLDREVAYIADDDPQAAQRVAKRILGAVEKLSSHPNIGRPGRVPGTRELVVSGTSYIIPYRVRRQSVEVLRSSTVRDAGPENLMNRQLTGQRVLSRRDPRRYSSALACTNRDFVDTFSNRVLTLRFISAR